MATVRIFSVPWRKGGYDFPALEGATLFGQLNNSPYAIVRGDGIREYTISEAFYQQGYFELPISIQSCKKCNYAWINKDGHLYFVFVDKMEWTNKDCTRFYFSIDNFSTYAKQAIIGGYRTRRRIDPSEKPESILQGDFIGNYKFPVNKQDFLFDGNFVNNPPYMLVYLNPSIEGDGTDLFAPYSNVYSQMVLALNWVDAGFFMSMISKGDNIADSVKNAIIGIYLFPSIFSIPQSAKWTIGGHSYPMIGYGNPTGDTKKPLKIGTYTLNGNSNNIFWNNNDTECVIVSDGREIKINPSDLSEPVYDVYLTLATSPAIVIQPHWKHTDKSRSITYANFPQLGLSVDQFASWQQRNMLSLISQSVMTGARFFAGDIAGGSASAINLAVSQLSSAREASTQTPFSTAQQSTAIQSAGCPFLSIQTRCWQNASSAGLAYYRREGFPCLDFGTINLSDYPENAPYDFYKCSDVTVAGVNAEAQQEIAQLLEKGIRAWNTVNIS